MSHSFIGYHKVIPLINNDTKNKLLRNNCQSFIGNMSFEK